MLARTLRMLTHEQLVRRLTWPTGAPHVEYDLTSDGRDLLKCLHALERWRIRHALSQRSSERLGLDESHELGLDITRPVSTVDRRGRPLEETRWTDLPPAPLMHVSLAVRDVNKTSASLSRLLGVAQPTTKLGSVEHKGGTGYVLLSMFQLRNFFIEVVQHESGETPYGEFTRAHGDGIHHVGFHVDRDRFEDRVRWLERRAGTRIIGGPAVLYASFDSAATLGTTIETVFKTDWNRWWTAPPLLGPQQSPWAGHGHVTHVGIVVANVHRAARAYAELFGVESPRIRTATPRFPIGVRAASNAYMKIAVVRRPHVSIHLIEPVGTSPMRQHLEEQGNGVHHIGLNVGAWLDPSVRALEALGARRVLGRRGDVYAHMDLRNDMGLVMELTGHPA
jgi:catechol 2,3-dioxygenase-like lactoylglutathione lyase family enzyme